VSSPPPKRSPPPFLPPFGDFAAFEPLFDAVASVPDFCDALLEPLPRLDETEPLFFLSELDVLEPPFFCASSTSSGETPRNGMSWTATRQRNPASAGSS